MSEVEQRVLDATKACLSRWGTAKVTIDDIAAEARVSRATLYRMFPGGKDVLFEALRVRELEDFLTRLRAQVEGAHDLEDLLVRCMVYATTELRADDLLGAALAAEPGETIPQLTVSGLPRVIRVATHFLSPLVEPYLDRREAVQLVELLSRVVISYFLAPSHHVDFGDSESARTFLRTFVLPSLSVSPTTTTRS
jgi:AcrR family transcriptional regulator